MAVRAAELHVRVNAPRHASAVSRGDLGIAHAAAPATGTWDCDDEGALPLATSEEIDGVEVDLTKLPDALQHLGPLMREWALGDDDEREAKHEAASTEGLQAMYDAVSPHFEAINTWLDAHDDEPEGWAVGRLAEGATDGPARCVLGGVR